MFINPNKYIRSRGAKDLINVCPESNSLPYLITFHIVIGSLPTFNLYRYIMLTVRK